MGIQGVVRYLVVPVALCCLMAISAFAQPAAYQFTAPVGWERATQGDTIVFTPKGEPPGSVKMMLMPVKPQQGDFDAQFTAECAELERIWGLREPRAIPPQRGRSNNGVYGVHSASYASNDGDRYVMLMGLAAKGAFGMLAFATSSGEPFNRLAGLRKPFRRHRWRSGHGAAARYGALCG